MRLFNSIKEGALNWVDWFTWTKGRQARESAEFLPGTIRTETRSNAQVLKELELVKQLFGKDVKDGWAAHFGTPPLSRGELDAGVQPVPKVKVTGTPGERLEVISAHGYPGFGSGFGYFIHVSGEDYLVKDPEGREYEALPGYEILFQENEYGKVLKKVEPYIHYLPCFEREWPAQNAENRDERVNRIISQASIDERVHKEIKYSVADLENPWRRVQTFSVEDPDLKKSEENRRAWKERGGADWWPILRRVNYAPVEPRVNLGLYSERKAAEECSSGEKAS